MLTTKYGPMILVSILTIVGWDIGDRVFSHVAPDHKIEFACVAGSEYVIFATGAVATGKPCTYVGFKKGE